MVESDADPSGWRAVAGDESTTAELRPVIDHYLRTGPEANLLVYYDDIGVPFEPALAGEHEYV